MACTNARDTITQADGEPLANHFDYDDSEHTVTSYCRTADGTWIAWINTILGDSTDETSGLPDNDTNKADWPAAIASATAIGVGFFPDDGSGPIVYELGVDPTYEWDGHGFYAARDICALWPALGAADYYANSNKAILTAWAMGMLDLQVRSDGTNVWVIALAHEAVKYPFLYNAPSEIDKCGHTHETFESYWSGGGSDPFNWDTDSGNRFWKYGEAVLGGDQPFGPYDDPGDQNSLRWQPARVTVWAGDIGGFTRLDTVEAKFKNDGDSGLCSGVEAAASPAEPGVLHVLWAEGGNFGFQTYAPKRGQRVNYSRWDTGGKTLDTDLLYVEEDGSGDIEGDWVWTAEMILRNDHGSPVAVVWPIIFDADTGATIPDKQAQFWDLSSGAIEILQTLDPTLAVTAGEAQAATGQIFTDDPALQGGATVAAIATRSSFASGLYTDPLLGNRDVYLVCACYANGSHGVVAIYRIPCDGSDTFTFLDGHREVGYSIVSNPLDAIPPFAADFVADPDNIWMPALVNAGGAINHFTRRCTPTWELLPCFPASPDTGYEDGQWTVGRAGVPEIVTDDAGDWIAGAGTGPLLTVYSTDPTEIAALRAKICRCCVPCEALGVRLWKRV